MDILPDRTQAHLSAYFREMNRNERYRVKYFVCDMWQPYIKVLKRISYGIRNFERFRTRILHSCN